VTSATFNWDFIGIPGGAQSLVLDPLAVSKTAPNLDEAYQFAKWMSFSPDAYAKEVELTSAAGSYPKFPVAMDAASLAAYKAIVDKPGITAAIENLDASITESLVKIVPGYGDARWDGKPGINVGTDQDVNMWYMFNAAITGTINYADYATQLNTFVNGLMDTAKAAITAQ
jgi:multiple sugar transport system substrate-binding protein